MLDNTRLGKLWMVTYMWDGKSCQRKIEYASRRKIGSRKIFGRKRGRNNMRKTGKEYEVINSKYIFLVAEAASILL